MKVTIVYPGLIPSKKYGGTQRVIWGLGKELVGMGHKVCFLVEKGSECPFAEVRDIDPKVPISKQVPGDTDIVHFNDHASADGLSKPYVVTIHGNRPPEVLDANSIFVSHNHAERFGSDSFVYNGLDWDSYGVPDLDKSRKGFHFLANASWKVKNLAGAIDTIKKIDDGELEVMGGYRFNFKMGWRFTFNPKIHFHGMVDDAQKKQIIQGSKGLLFPVRWHEPFGLAIIESMYFGAPVFGTPYGSLPELVPEECGYLSADSTDLATHLKYTIGDYSPQVCHEYVSDTFSAKNMAMRYIEKYEKVLNGEPLNKSFEAREKYEVPLPWQ